MVAYSPDPAPGTGNKPITYVSYTYDVPALNKHTHQRIPHYWFRVDVAANGARHYTLFRR